MARSSRPIWASKSNFSMTSRVFVERGDPGAEVGCDLGGVGEDLLQGQRAGVVDLDAGDRLENRADVIDAALEGREAAPDLQLRGLEDAVEPSQEDERQDGPPVLRLLVVAPEQVGDGPNELAVVVDPGALDHTPPGPLSIPTVRATIRAATPTAWPDRACRLALIDRRCVPEQPGS